MKDKKKILIPALLGCFIPLILYKIIGKIIRSHILNEYYSNFFSQVIFALFTFISVIVLKKTHIYSCDNKKLKKGWTSSILLIVLMCFYMVFAWIMLFNIQATPLELLCFLGQLFLIGYCEETLFRGIMQNAYHEVLGEDSQLHVIIAIVLGGFTFGLTHLSNIFSDVNPMAAIVQATLTSFMGMYFGAIYFRTGKHLWFLVLLHALWDGVAFLFSGRLAGGSTTDALNATKEISTSGVLIYGAIYLLATIIVLRKSKVEPMLHNQL